MIAKIKQLFNRGPEWWEEEFPLGNPFSEGALENILNPPKLTDYMAWDQKEVEKRKWELRQRRETTPVELPSIPTSALDESMKVKDWYETFNDLGLLGGK